MIKVTAIYHFANTFFPDFFRFLSKEDWIELRVLYCYPTTETGIIDKKTGIYSDWGDEANLLDGYNYINMEHRFNSGPSDVLKLCNPQVKSLISKENTDVLVIGSSYWAPTTWMAIKTAKRHGIPIVTRATIENRRKRKWYIQIVREFLVKKYCKEMSAGVYECEDQKKFLLAHGMSEMSIFYAPCAVNNEKFQDYAKKTDRQKERRKLGINDDRIVYLYVAGMNRRKRPMDLLLAYEILRKDRNDIALIFVGDGPEEESISEYVKNNNIEDVVVAGFADREEIMLYYALSDVYVLPSQDDASPKTLNEAMNFSLPIVITNGVGTSNELLDEGENGFIYNAGDVEKLNEILRWFSNNRERIPKMGNRSREIVSENGLPKVCEGWHNAVRYALRK